jgi:hypothetical protein
MEHGGWYPDRQLRFFKSGAGRFSVVPLHESLQLLSEGARRGHLAHPILHYTYPSAADFIMRADRYTTIEAKAMAAEHRFPRSIVSSLIFAVPSKFAEVYFYKGGWRDGMHGFIGAMLMSMRVFLRYVKAWELRKGDSRL